LEARSVRDISVVCLLLLLLQLLHVLVLLLTHLLFVVTVAAILLLLLIATDVAAAAVAALAAAAVFFHSVIKSQSGSNRREYMGGIVPRGPLSPLQFSYPTFAICANLALYFSFTNTQDLPQFTLNIYGFGKLKLH
jgi:hypothetical protein